MNIERCLRLPWTISVEQLSDDGKYFVATVEQLPGLIATGDTPEDLDRDLWAAIEAYVRVALEHGDTIGFDDLPSLRIEKPSILPEPDVIGASSTATTRLMVGLLEQKPTLELVEA